MKKGLRKAIASMLAVTMVLGSSIMSFAGGDTPAAGVSNNTSLTASGNFEGHVDKSVVNVTLPTVSADNYNFIIDPEDLIAQTDGARYEDAQFVSENSTGVYFPTSVSANGDTIYTNESVSGNVTNKSSVSVNVTMAIELTDLNDSITMVSKNGVSEGTDANLWLAVTDGTNEEEVAETSAELTAMVPGTDGNYMVSWNAAKSEYQYVIDPDAEGEWETVNLYLTGACNKNGDWSADALKDASTVEVTWSYEEVGAGVAGVARVLKYQNINYLALKGAENAAFEANATSVIVNGKDMTENAILLNGFVAVKATDLVAADIDIASGSKLDVKYTVDGTQYIASLIVGQQ